MCRDLAFQLRHTDSTCTQRACNPKVQCCADGSCAACPAGAQAGSSRHWYIIQGHVYIELFHRCGSISANQADHCQIAMHQNLMLTGFSLAEMPNTWQACFVTDLLPAADIFEKIATETATLARYNKKPTVTSREIQTAGM